jgi:predicted cupin superfamily sugar epimerase
MAKITLLSCLLPLALLSSLVQGAIASKPVEKRSAQEVVAQLGLAPNPEKGYFKEIFRDPLMINTGNGTRSASTAIYYLLEGSAGQSLWHRIDAAEVWHYYAGAPLKMFLSHNNGTGVRNVVLGPDVFKSQQPAVVIGSWEWQSCKSTGDWTLVGTTGEFVPFSRFTTVP